MYRGPQFPPLAYLMFDPPRLEPLLVESLAATACRRGVRVSAAGPARGRGAGGPQRRGARTQPAAAVRSYTALRGRGVHTQSCADVCFDAALRGHGSCTQPCAGVAFVRPLRRRGALAALRGHVVLTQPCAGVGFERSPARAWISNAALRGLGVRMSAASDRPHY